MAPPRTVLLLLVLACATSAAFAQPKNRAPGQYLYVASGDQDKVHPDQLVVFNFNKSSPTYGKVVNRVTLTRGNEPKLVVSNLNNTQLVLGGFLTFLTGQTATQKDTFFFSLTNPALPKLVANATTPTSALPSYFAPRRDGSWLSTRMGDKLGNAPGKLAEFTAQGVYRNEYGAGPTFNPHGLAINERLDLAITVDFLAPRSALYAFRAPKVALTGLALRSNIRLWKISTKAQTGTVAVPDLNAGLLDIKLIPGDSLNRSLVTGSFSGKIYLVTPNPTRTAATVATALNLAPLFGNKNPGPSYMTLVPKYKIGFVSLTFNGSVAMFNWTNPAALKIIKTVPLGRGSNPGYIEAFKGDDRLTVTTYFLDLLRPGPTPRILAVRGATPFGNINLTGNKTVRVFTFTAATFAADPKWPNPNFNTLFPLSGVQTPHGIAYYPAN